MHSRLPARDATQRDSANEVSLTVSRTGELQYCRPLVLHLYRYMAPRKRFERSCTATRIHFDYGRASFTDRTYKNEPAGTLKALSCTPLGVSDAPGNVSVDTSVRCSALSYV